MGRVTEKTMIVSAASAGSTTGWINLNTNQENFHIGFAIKNTGQYTGIVPVLNIDGTLQDILTSAAVASGDYFSLISAVSTSAIGTNVAGEITFPVAAVRLRAVSGGSGNTILNFKVIQAGKI